MCSLSKLQRVLHTLTSRCPLPAHHPPFLACLSKRLSKRLCSSPGVRMAETQPPNLQELYHRHTPNVFDKNFFRELPGSPGVRTPCFQGRGHGFNPWSGNSHPTSHGPCEAAKNKCFNKNSKYSLFCFTMTIIYYYNLSSIHCILTSFLNRDVNFVVSSEWRCMT